MRLQGRWPGNTLTSAVCHRRSAPRLPLAHDQPGFGRGDAPALAQLDRTGDRWPGIEILGEERRFPPPIFRLDPFEKTSAPPGWASATLPKKMPHRNNKRGIVAPLHTPPLPPSRQRNRNKDNLISFLLERGHSSHQCVSVPVASAKFCSERFVYLAVVVSDSRPTLHGQTVARYA